MITVFGATGKTGQQVVRGLVERGVAVRAFVRDTEKAQALLPAGVEIVVGDLTDRDAVRRALTGVDKVYLAVGEREDQQQLEETVVDEVAATGVTHLVKISVPGASPDSPVLLGRWHGAVEQRINEAGLPAVTIIRPNWFSQNFLGSAPTIASHNTIYAAAGEGRIAPIDARDVAAVAVVALTEDGHAGGDYYVTGPEALSHSEIAGRLGRVLGRDVSYVDLPDGDFLSALVGAGVPQWYAEAFAELMPGVRAGWFEAVSPVVDELLGKTRSFDDFARDNIKAFAA